MSCTCLCRCSRIACIRTSAGTQGFSPPLQPHGLQSGTSNNYSNGIDLTQYCRISSAISSVVLTQSFLQTRTTVRIAFGDLSVPTELCVQVVMHAQQRPREGRLLRKTRMCLRARSMSNKRGHIERARSRGNPRAMGRKAPPGNGNDRRERNSMSKNWMRWPRKMVSSQFCAGVRSNRMQLGRPNWTCKLRPS